MSELYLLDDATARGFEPFALTRPTSELRAGTELLRARWELAAATSATAFIGAPHLADFTEDGAPSFLAHDTTIPAGAIIVNSRFAIALGESLGAAQSAWQCDGQTCAVRLSRPLNTAMLADGSFDLSTLATGDRTALRGRWISAVWDFIAQLPVQLTEDIAASASSVNAEPRPGTTLGSHTVTIERGASIEPYVVFDASAGPILVRTGATVAAFTRLVGPCYIGADCVIVGDRVANCSIGEKSKIRGEISSTIVLGHSNKGHTGFVGHSYLGRWVNLGAGTTTSNLKNTYGTVQLWTPHGNTDTGQQFLGTMFGDHVKTGIGTMLNTGTVLGAGANVFGGSLHPKHVAAFAWGDGEPYASYQIDKFLDVAERMMKRRGVATTEALRRHFSRAYERAGRC
jgi:UDP-N-acetylglucosamine diphosphorylase/glucosamine-1-phosphate N-acetyltransferase